MPADAEPPRLLVGPLLRHVTETSATLFVETDRACTVEVLGHAARTFHVAGHHYALVMIEDLAPASIVEYDVHVDGVQLWPPAGSGLPPSCIRTLGHDRPTRVLFGSCRAAVPHHPPFTWSRTTHPEGRGVDSLRAHGRRMLGQAPEQWPDLLMLLGDQVYADEPSPRIKARLRRRRHRHSSRPEHIVGGFEHYTWLYQEAWRPELERWLLSVVPSSMIFDDHDMIDDWNISAEWVRDIRREPWWEEHVLGALASYWIYQHLGNLSPGQIREEGLLAQLLDADDGAEILWAWARESERMTPVPGGYPFSYARDLGRTRVIVIDCRNGRVLEPERAMIDDDEWRWLEEQCRGDVDHLLIATSLPVLVPGALHDLQMWNAALCDGARGAVVARLSERVRRALDLEDWSAFESSLVRMVDLLRAIARGEHRGGEGEPPAVVAVLSGDIHFAYAARLEVTGTASRVHQLVSSPIRNPLPRTDRRVLRFALGRTGRAISRALLRTTGRAHLPTTWQLEHGPEFANEMGLLEIDGRSMQFVLERARPGDDETEVLETVVRTPL